MIINLHVDYDDYDYKCRGYFGAWLRDGEGPYGTEPGNSTWVIMFHDYYAASIINLICASDLMVRG